MPTYDYHCEKCNHSWEEFQSITAPQIELCPACQEKTAHRLISGGAGVVFKGNGFYSTDYRPKPQDSNNAH